VVRTQFTLQKSAFTMIELIFAIVIIGITVISLPMMTQATSKGMESNLAQEAIFAASAELNQALSYKWNGNSQENFGELSKIVGTTAQDCNSTTRPGLIHRMCLNTSANIANLTAGVDNVNFSDYSINNADTTATGDINIFTPGTGSASGYKENYTMNVDVNFTNFGTITEASNNMKVITVTVKKLVNSVSEDYVVLKAYSANIGETEAAKRVF
jgi:prepilin-type N-terminal cleavage/methylation domain-containing protein